MAALLWVVGSLLLATGPASSEEVSMRMPGASPDFADSYLCTAFSTAALLPTGDDGVAYIQGFRPVADAKVAHHMLLHTCRRPGHPEGVVYDCLGGPTCQDASSIIFGWAKNAKSMQMPKDVSMHTDTADVKYFVLQVHYAKALETPDNSTTLILTASKEK